MKHARHKSHTSEQQNVRSQRRIDYLPSIDVAGSRTQKQPQASKQALARVSSQPPIQVDGLPQEQTSIQVRAHEQKQASRQAPSQSGDQPQEQASRQVHAHAQHQQEQHPLQDLPHQQEQEHQQEQLPTIVATLEAEEEPNRFYDFVISTLGPHSFFPIILKGYVLMAIVCIVGKLGPSMPVWLFIICFVLLSSLISLSAMLPWVFSRISNRGQLIDDCLYKRLNEGRRVCVVATFILAAICLGPLLLNIPMWSFEDYVLLAVMVPCYALAYFIVRKTFGSQYKPFYRNANVLKKTGGAFCVFLIIVSIVFASYGSSENVTAFSTLYDENFAKYGISDFSLYTEASKLAALYESIQTYGLAKFLSQTPDSITPFVLRCVVTVCSSVSLTSILSLSAISKNDALSIFEVYSESLEPLGINKRFASFFLALPCVVCVVLILLNGWYVSNANIDQTWVDSFVSSWKEGMKNVFEPEQPPTLGERIMQFFGNLFGNSE